MDTMDSINIDELRAVLANDPRLPAAEEIAVDSYGDSVTLRGTVGSFAQQRAAVADAWRVMGVADVVDELNVRLLDDDRREDATIRGAALQRLIWDSLIPGDDLDVKVGDGWLTLKGEVEFQFQSDLAFDDVAGLYGVIGVTNEIKVVEIV
jgi:osmotically-inducible protein OsmY